MQSSKGNPATLAACGAPKNDLAGASIYSDNIANLPPIQADPRAELRFARQLAATVFGASSNSQSGRLVLESKDDMKKRGMPSPDEGDAVALCFSEPGGAPVVANSNFNRVIEYPNQGYV